MPFPKKLDATANDSEKARNKACEEYWKDHVFLCTPDEMRAAISQMSAAGKDVSRQTSALLSFQVKGSVSPLKQQTDLSPSKEAILLSFEAEKGKTKTSNDSKRAALLQARKQHFSR